MSLEDDIKKAIEEQSKQIDEYFRIENDKRLKEIREENEQLGEQFKNMAIDYLKLPKPNKEYSYPFGCGCTNKVNRCKGCVFLDRYVDMGMSADMCSIVSGIDASIRATKADTPCPCKLTYQEAYEYVARRNGLVKKD